jgi:hypothetical protein
MIDIHTHPVQVAELVDEDPALAAAVRDVFGLYMKPQPFQTFVSHMEEAGAEHAVLLPIDCTTAHGCTIVSNEQVAALMARDERLIGFASVDPQNHNAADELRVAVDRFGLRGLKLDPALQQFALNDRERAYPLYEVCIELDIPVLVHCGLSWAPLGQAARAHPLDLEMPVQELPELKVIIAHLGWPWTAEAMMLAIKHRNVHLDTSVLFGGPPADALRKAIDSTVGLATLNRSLPDQIVFGSNYPRVDPKRAAHAVRDLGLPASLERRIFDTNARRLLKLEDS